MSGRVSPTQVATARSVDLSTFLLDTYPLSFDRDAETGVLHYNPAHPIRDAVQAIGLEDATFDGNPIDFLMRHLGYSFVNAVKVLARYAKHTPEAVKTPPAAVQACEQDPYALPAPDPEKPFDPPLKALPPYSRLFGFLRNKQIPYATGKRLVCQNLLYQSSSHANAVFLNRNQDYFEVMETLSFSNKPYFHCNKKQSDAYWSVRNSAGTPERIYICSTALDAVALMELHRQAGIAVPAAYTSVGTDNVQPAVQRIIRNAEQISAVVYLAVSKQTLKLVKLSTIEKTGFYVSPNDSWCEDLRTNVPFQDLVKGVSDVFGLVRN